MINKEIVKKLTFVCVFSFLFYQISLFGQQAKLESETFQAGALPKRGIHGLFNTTLTNYYITPRGLIFIDRGLIIQILAGYALDVYTNEEPCAKINNVTVFVQGLWDIWNQQGDPFVGAFNEFDWFVGFAVTFAKYWKTGAQFIQFLSPPHHFVPTSNIEFLLAYDDSAWKNPIVINPYVKLFWMLHGTSVVAVGRNGKVYDVEVGAVPTYKLEGGAFPLTLTAPTWITVGPKAFWSGGDLALKHVNCHFGVFSTGLTGTVPLNKIAKKYGEWAVSGGVQYYYLINRNLRQAQTITLNTSLKHAHRNVGQVFASVSVNF